jgi:hypothetical protein
MKPVALLYARRDVGGGSTSYAVHLYRAMQMAGIPVKMYRLASTSRDTPRRMAKYYGVDCWYIDPEQACALVREVPTLLVGPEHSRKLPEPDLLRHLIALGMRIVVHDPNEFMSSGHTSRDGVYDHLRDKSLIKRPICIRPTMKQFFPDAVFIPHPYVRCMGNDEWEPLMRRKPACSIARITFVKRTHLILEANAVLPKRLQVQLHGAENRLYTRFKLQQKLGFNFKQGGYNLPLTHGVSARKASEYTFAVDFTYFPQDGGGSQYTFMEAWDAGTINVIHEDWLRYQGEMAHGLNCIAVASPAELVELLRNYHTSRKIRNMLKEIQLNGQVYLDGDHNPKYVAKAYYKELYR